MTKMFVLTNPELLTLTLKAYCFQLFLFNVGIHSYFNLKIILSLWFNI